MSTKELKPEGKYRCKMCNKVFEVPGITFESDPRNGKKTPIDCCPFCPSLNFVSLEKVVSHVKETPVKEKLVHIKLDEYKYVQLISNFSQLDQLKAIKIMIDIYKQNENDLHTLDVVLKSGITHERIR